MAQPRDRFARPLRDLRISVTDRCNFRCSYCMPAELFGPDHAFLPKRAILSYEEILRIAQSFTQLGTQKIRITGGEPLLRKDIAKLIEMLATQSGASDISLTTNGILLPRLAQRLKDAGLGRLNVSLDSLHPERFAAMSGGRGSPQKVLEGIEAATEAGLPVKVNMVVKRAASEADILPMVSHFKQLGIPLRFIEFMDVGQSNGWSLQHVVPARQILDVIASEHEFEPIEPNYRGEVASRYRFLGTSVEFGIISSISKPFCGDCHRARLSADGGLYTCLFATAGTDLKAKIRSGLSQAELTDFISKIWSARGDRYSEERHAGAPSKQGKKIEMSYIGG